MPSSLAGEGLLTLPLSFGGELRLVRVGGLLASFWFLRQSKPLPALVLQCLKAGPHQRARNGSEV